MSESPARRAQLGPFGLYNDSPALSCGPASSTLLAGLSFRNQTADRGINDGARSLAPSGAKHSPG